MKCFFGYLTAVAVALIGVVPAQGQITDISIPLQEEERTALFPSQADVKNGQTLAESSCAGCHGSGGISTNQLLPNLAGQRPIYLYRQLLAYREGSRIAESMHRASAYLSDTALLQVAAYFAGLDPAPATASKATTADSPNSDSSDPLTIGKAATTSCAGCHGDTGNSKIPGMPNLTSQHPDYFVAAMKAYRGEGVARNHGMMKTLVGSLDDTTLEAMGLFYAMQEPLPGASRGSGNAQAGAKFAEACGSCHGSDGNASSADTPSLAGQDATYFVVSMKTYGNGSRDHTAMVTAVKGLSTDDIENIAAYYAEQTPVRRNVQLPLSTFDWLERCQRCHGLGGNSTDPRYPALAGQNREYLSKVLNAYADGSRSKNVMHAMSEPLRDEDISKLADYYSSSTPRTVLFVDLPCLQVDEN